MPQPCSKPLTPNPFESYRDPITGRWQVRYLANVLTEIPSVKEQHLLSADSIVLPGASSHCASSQPARPKPAALPKHWTEKKARDQVAV